MLAVLVNLSLNWVLIFGNLGFPALGVRGAAIATAISRYVEMSFILLFVHRRTEKYPFVQGLYRTLRLPWALVRKILMQGSP